MKHFPLIFLTGLLTLAATALLLRHAALSFDDLTPYARAAYISLWSLGLFIPNYLIGLVCGRLALSPSWVWRVVAALLFVPLGALNFWLALGWGNLSLAMGALAVWLCRSRLGIWLSKP